MVITRKPGAGRPKLIHDSVNVTLIMDSSMHDRLKKAASEQELSKSELVRRIIRDNLSRYE